MSAIVVGLGAWSELARRDKRGMGINVCGFAVLDDGRHLTLHHNRGFSTSAMHLTAEQVEGSVLTTVLPDDAEITGEDHPWEVACFADPEPRAGGHAGAAESGALYS